MRLSFATIITRALLALSLVGCGSDPAAPLRIGTSVWPGYEPLYLARELGYLDPKSVRLAEYPSLGEVTRAFKNQAIEAAALTFDEVLLLAQDGFNPRVTLVMDISFGADAILGRAELRTVKDLAGRPMAVDTRTVGAYVLARALMLNGLKPSDVNIVHVEHDEHEAALKEGRVDAVVNFEPLRSQLLAEGASLLFDSSQIPGEIVDVLAFEAAYLEKNPAVVKEVLRGWFRAIEYMQTHPQDASARMAQREQITGAQFLESLKGLKIPSRVQNLQLLGGQHPLLASSGRRLMQVMLDQRLLNTAPDVQAILAPGPLEDLSP
ncbi:MAG: ABC transporter substrate-binding protein [Gammaproteobacteria bacterium]